MTIRPAKIEDAGELSEIYRFYVENTAVTFDLFPPDKRFFEEKIAHVAQRYPFLTLTLTQGAKEETVGYAYASPFKDRPAFDYLVETSLYLRSDVRGKGFGRALYAALEAELKKQNVLRMEACIAVPTAPDDPFLTFDSARFHEKLGFRRVAFFEKSGWKFGRWFDMIWMEKSIREAEGTPEPFIPYPMTGTQDLKT